MRKLIVFICMSVFCASMNAQTYVTGNFLVNYILGDVDGNNVVDIKDLVMLISALNNMSAEPYIDKAADINKDEKVNLQDVILLADMLLKNK